MSPEDFGVTGRALFGKGWQTRLSERIGVDGSTIRRWVGSGMAIPPTASAFLSMMTERQNARGALACSRQTIGEQVGFDGKWDLVEHAKLIKPRWFPFEDMDRSKYMPSIGAHRVAGNVMVSLDAEVQDDIQTDDLSFVLTRHPDPYHLDGYRAEAGRRGHRLIAVKYGDHFYSLIVHRIAGPPMLLHHIVTHQEVNRMIWSPASSPKDVIHSRLF